MKHTATPAAQSMSTRLAQRIFVRLIITRRCTAEAAMREVASATGLSIKDVREAVWGPKLAREAASWETD